MQFRNKRERDAVVKHMRETACDALLEEHIIASMGQSRICIASPISALRADEGLVHGVQGGGDAESLVPVRKIRSIKVFQVALDRFAKLLEPVGWWIVLHVAHCNNRDGKCFSHASRVRLGRAKSS